MLNAAMLINCKYGLLAPIGFRHENSDIVDPSHKRDTFTGKDALSMTGPARAADYDAQAVMDATFKAWSEA